MVVVNYSLDPVMWYLISIDKTLHQLAKRDLKYQNLTSIVTI